jgi:hypothetical protein
MPTDDCELQFNIEDDRVDFEEDDHIERFPTNR